MAFEVPAAVLLNNGHPSGKQCYVHACLRTEPRPQGVSVPLLAFSLPTHWQRQRCAAVVFRGTSAQLPAKCASAHGKAQQLGVLLLRFRPVL